MTALDRSGAAQHDGPLLPPLRHPLARVLLAAFVVLHAGLVLASSGTAPIPLVALLLVCGAAAAVVLPAHLRRATAVACAAAILVAAGAVVLALPLAGWPGYAAWPLGAATFIAVALTLRGRIALAWALLAGLTIECVVWSVLAGGGPLPGLNLEVRHAGTLLLGTLFAIGLRRAAASLDAFHRAEREQQVAHALISAAGQEQRKIADRFLALAGGALQRLGASSAVPPAERADLLALEGRLRDEITAPALLTEALNDAVADARRRGVDVVLLVQDARPGALPPSALPRIVDWVVEQVRAVPVGRIVVRITSGDRRLRASAHTDRADSVLELPID